MRKSIIYVLIIMILFSVLFVSPVQAGIDASQLVGRENLYINKNAVEQFSETGTAQSGTNRIENVRGKATTTALKQKEKNTALANDQQSYIAVIFASLFEMGADFLDWLVSVGSGETKDGFQIEKLLFNEYKIFDINFFTKAETGDGLNSFANTIRDLVARWYSGIRIIAIIASLPVLIYIAIRMSLSTISQEKVKYKKMLESWITSLIILFTLQYIVLIMVYISDGLVKMLQSIKVNFGIETTLKDNLNIDNFKGWQAFSAGLMLLILSVIQLKFFIIYFKRMIVAAFLLTISPLITITYSIDKVADNTAQAFKSWIKEMIMVVFMQPMHALLFLIYAFSASEIIKFAPLLGILVLWSITKGETIFRNILGLQGSKSVGSLQDTRLMDKVPLSL